ncbi:alpha/beta fold hydrolase [Arthrobacter psychrochitiniphilus]|uniref:Alpha/beta hydrolase n=1 Tax=Arthrobacter psychrochitiniphilus TaxID=291045 RepID=A0A2V3DNW9_9MICC|nr:alpha/beta fold hydrolase [Arthrobacter psychrochitiniphilus]NYG17574.1 proline iminopeptidase [Arthrobacter psychrochitiniphilus]PXA64672.1 alpha/beta hydrolase [Arthrobacter psychrochitiniphilus]
MSPTDAYTIRGVRMRDHRFTVPLDHAHPGGTTLELFARELSDARVDGEALPWLLFLQGGPGGRGNRPAGLSGWLAEATRHFRVLMLDQRGTGLSTPANRQTLPLVGSAAEQAEYLSHFRATDIVADAEFIRAALGSGPWSVFGQSYGGFCALSYLSFAPEGVKEALITGGLAPLTGPADQVYQATFERLRRRNAEYFAKYPTDREVLTRIMAHTDAVAEFLPTGERLTRERVQMLGNLLGGNTRFDSLHYVLEDAFVPTLHGVRLSDGFLAQLSSQVDRSTGPLYALMHESIYVQGEASNWAAARVLAANPDFLPDAAQPLLSGEAVYPWYFEQDPALSPLQEVAQLLAVRTDGWGKLYNLEQLALNSVPVAAAVYRDDIFVDRDLSLATAAAVNGLQVWESADFHHDGIADDGEGIFARLLGMVRA